MSRFPAGSARLLRLCWVGAAALSAAAAVVAARDWHLSLVLGVLAMLCAVCAIRGAHPASCPACGAPSQTWGRHRRTMICARCAELARACEAVSPSVPADYVHPFPVFTAKLRANTKWAGCVACRAAATRTLTCRISEKRIASTGPVSQSALSVLDTVAISFSYAGGRRSWRVRLPFCDAHHQGALVDSERGEVVIRFRSNAAYRRFLRANGVAPGEIADASLL